MPARLKFLQPLALIAVTIGLYWPSRHYLPFFDDTNFFENGLLQHIFLNGFAFDIRWLPYFITAWVDLLFDDTIFAQRSLNVGLHLASGFVLYALIRQVADHAAPHPNNRRAALAATLLFLLHPLGVYAVGYLIQRTILMATLFGLLALSTYFDGLAKRQRAYFLFSALFYLLSSFSKEHAVLIPAAALALTPLAVPLTRQTWRQLVLPCVLYLPIALLVVFKKLSLVGAAYEPFAQSLVTLQWAGYSGLSLWALSAMTQAALFFKYLGLMLVPYPGWMSIDMRVPFAAHFWQPKYWIAVAALAGYAVISLIWLLRGGRRGLLGFALLAPLLLFAVEFSTVKIQEPFVLYRSYLWMAPLFLMMPAVTHMLPDKLFWPAVLVVALAFAHASSDRLHSFSSADALWDDAVRKLPAGPVLGTARVHTNRGALAMKRGDLRLAIADFTHALEADPGYKRALSGRAFAYMKLGDYPPALADANAVIRLDPEDRGSYIVRGHVYKSRGDRDLALADFEYGCQKEQWAETCVVLLSRPTPKQPKP